MSEWIDELKTEMKTTGDNKEFSKNNVENFIAEFMKIADVELAKINEEFFGGKPICKTTTTNPKIFFDVVIGEMEKTILHIKFEPQEFIKVARQLVKSTDEIIDLPEIIAIRMLFNGQHAVTFEPEFYSGSRATERIDEELISRLLVEPALREHFKQPQINYVEEFSS